MSAGGAGRHPRAAHPPDSGPGAAPSPGRASPVQPPNAGPASPVQPVSPPAFPSPPGPAPQRPRLPGGREGPGGAALRSPPRTPQPPPCCRDLGIRPREIPGHRGCGGFNPFPAAPQCPQRPGGLPPRVGTSVVCPAPPGAVPPPGLRKRGHWRRRDHGEGLGSLPRSPSLPQHRVLSLTVPSVPSSVPQCRSPNCRTQMRFSVSPRGPVGCGATYGCCPCTSHPPSVLSGLQQ